MPNINNLPTKSDIHDADEFLTETIQSEETRNTPYSVVRQDIESNLQTQLIDFTNIHKNKQQKEVFRKSGQTTMNVDNIIYVDMSSYTPGNYYSLELKIGLFRYVNSTLIECMATFNTELFVFNNLIKSIISNDNINLLTNNYNNGSSVETAIEKLKLANSVTTGKTSLHYQHIQQDESTQSYFIFPDILVNNTISNNILTITILSYSTFLDYNIKVTKNKFS